ncbi:hypothetical protein GUITHDRAFT_103901 [Guillardia theta CCMP2712]|uniref:Protein kinase domain-containing protein n=1 Tax=Guillardia theta (strain CCMP2712) TaxID=905079 RepID=L1JRF5_GUITC|nr:hypothetical protein GUITHDRAFT_103901 [Guillardia theta CCMP2712]EKX50673.1 hypothetical protein GUITHDRAFT_103901 [Guillardia theta CCMP2712]|eukprot:XP_005837653.1 hypothetical protein GUITHDRAFT_103901 [Guillardia theta CCMP2712]
MDKEVEFVEQGGDRQRLLNAASSPMAFGYEEVASSLLHPAELPQTHNELSDGSVRASMAHYNVSGQLGSPSEHFHMQNASSVYRRSMNENFNIQEKEIDRLEKIGEGVVGNIYRGRWRMLDVAIKELKVDYEKGSIAHSDLLKDFSMWSRVRHPNICMFLGIVISSEVPAIVCEMMEGGSMETFFVQNRKRYGRDWRPSSRKALCYLHESSPPIVHRDIKPANLLLSADHSFLKLTDFGLARVRPGGTYNMSGKTGTKRYMAPEVVRCEGDYGTPVDIYSAGMIMWQMCAGQRPLEHISADAVACRASDPQENLRPSMDRVRWKDMQSLIVMVRCGTASPWSDRQLEKF